MEDCDFVAILLIIRSSTHFALSANSLQDLFRIRIDQMVCGQQIAEAARSAEKKTCHHQLIWLVMYPLSTNHTPVAAILVAEPQGRCGQPRA
jgi:hypothetical protein